MPYTRPRTDVFYFIDMKDGDANQCWPWRGARGGRDDRPYFPMGKRRLLAYRVVYELMHGKEIPHGVVARHTCDNPLCCNPWHIELGSHKDNMSDMRHRSRSGLPSDVVLAVKRSLRAGMLNHQQIAQTITSSVQDRGIRVSKHTVSRISRQVAYAEIGNAEARELKQTTTRGGRPLDSRDGESVVSEQRDSGDMGTEVTVHVEEE